MSPCALCASVLTCSRDLCPVVLGPYWSADACARSHRVFGAYCTACVVLHRQYFVCGAALLGAVRHTVLCVPRRTTLLGSEQWAVSSGTSSNVLPPCCGRWVVELLLCTAIPPRGGGRCNPYDTRPNCRGAMGGATPSTHCLTARGHGAVEILQRTTSLPGGGGQWDSCMAVPHCLGTVGSGTHVMNCLTA